ncbi:MAG: hypothetical protein V1816_06680 [Pseudomonadota bacterium]
MTKKFMVSVLLVLGLVAVGATAFAWGPGWGGWGQGGHMGYGRGMMGGGPGGQGVTDEEGRKLWAELDLKARELDAALAAPQVDADRVKALQADASRLRGELDQKNLAAELELRKNNPAYRGGYGPGYGRGPGYCRR